MYQLLFYLSLVVIICLTLYLILYRRNIKKIVSSMKEVKESKSNQLIGSDFTDNDMVELLQAVNEILEHCRSCKREIATTNRQFKETITNISHDLRTPLTSANSYLQMVEKGGLLEEEQKEYIEIIRGRMEEMKGLLDQLFEYARLESHELILEDEPVDLCSILYDTLTSFYSYYKERKEEPKISIEKEEAVVYGDKRAIHRVFSNIIYNGLVHGSGNYKVTLEDVQDSYQITFSNDAEGVTKEDVEHLFERFYTTDKSRNRKTTGLGLSIVRLLVEQMGGSVSAVLHENQLSIIITMKK